MNLEKNPKTGVIVDLIGPTVSSWYPQAMKAVISVC
jgi:hypothetical protein